MGKGLLIKRIYVLALSFLSIVGIKAQDMTATPLTLEAVEAGTITIKNANELTLNYTSSVNGVKSASANPITIEVVAGETLALTCNNTDKMLNFGISSSNDIYFYGNPLSMVFGNDFSGKTSMEGCGYGILGGLFHPAMDGETLYPHTKNHPTNDLVLPATTISAGCYQWMFSGCTSLTRAPKLPATVLADDCYHRMFENCTSLTVAPELPAATLIGQCYGGMFDGCTSLNYVKCLATVLGEMSGQLACGDWLLDVPATGTFVKAEGMDGWTVGPQGEWNAVYGIPAKWTVLEDNPLTMEAVEAGTINIVNPNTLTIEYSKDGRAWTQTNSNPISIAVVAGDKVRFRGDNPAYGMIKQVGENPWDTREQYTRFTATNDVYLYGNVMSLISSTNYMTLKTLAAVGGSNPADMDINLANLFSTPESGDNWAPTNNTTIKNHPTKDIILPATNVTRSGYMYMFSGCEGLTRAPELPATDLGWGCYHQMFSNCTGLTAAPVLPATTLPDNAYSCMFYHCSNLSYVKCLATDISAAECTGGWLTGVAATGTFVKAAGMDNWTVGPQGEWNEVNGIPAGWTVQEEGGSSSFVAVETPLTLEALEDGTTITVTNPKALTIQYSTDGGMTWTSSSAKPITISGIAAGSTVQFRGNNAAYSDGTVTNSTIINSDKDCYIYGNVMSLVSAEGFATATALTANYAFYNLFDSNAHLKNHDTKDIVLPATTLTEGCYSYMFYKCTALTKAPALPATTLATACYKSMFSSCSGLTKACELPAMTMVGNCYENMFRACSSLTTAPALPATALADYCYSFMFYACSKLEAAPALPATTMAPYCYGNMFGFCNAMTATPALPATTLAENCYYRMFLGCKALTTITSLPATTMAPYCYNEMFRQCQALTTGPTLPATTLANYCYRCMFQACTALTTPPALPAATLEQGCYLGMFVNTGMTAGPALPATTLAKSCYYQMFQNNQKLKSSPALPATELAETCYLKMFADCPLLENAGDLSATTAAESSCEYMFSNCVKLVKAPALPATTLAPACYNYMFQGCTSLTNAPELPATTLASQCYQRMFDGCTSLVDAPALPATNLAELCYNDMFWECTALKNAPDLPATTLADYCYTMMFLGCTSLEIAPDLPAAKLTSGCYEHMFMNCNNLRYVKCLATDLGDDTSTDGWMTNVAATGIFVKATGTDWTGKGTTEGTWGDPNSSEGTIPCTFIHGIPAGWTVQEAPVGIKHVETTKNTADEILYDLYGHRISGKPVPGIYIKNGRKILVK